MTLESTSRAAGAAGGPARLHPSIALAPYVEALVVGRRVAVLGDATLGLAEALLARGARLVHAYDPDPARVAEAIARKAPAFGSPAAGRPAARGVVHALLGDDLGVREGAFDAVLVPDLGAFADRVDVIRRAKKLCAHSGAVVVASSNPEAKRRLLGGEGQSGAAPGYYELFDLLSLQFPAVRMVGQAPFVGYAIVDFAPDREPDVTFDASLMSGTEEPEIFVAIASERPIGTDAYLVVEVPAADVLARHAARAATAAEEGAIAGLAARHGSLAEELTYSGPPSSRDDLRGPGAAAELAEAKARLVLMQAELDDLRAQRASLAREIDAARLASKEADARAQGAAAEAARAQGAAADAARAAEDQAEKWRELSARAGDEHVRAERMTHKVRDLEEELVRQRDRSQKLTKALDDEKRLRQKAEIELGMSRGLPRPDEVSSARAEELAAELARANTRVEELASALREANARADGLGRELREAASRADGLANELLAKSRETAELRREHEAAATRAAELTQALQVAQTRITDLEEDQVRTLRRPDAMREPVLTATELDTGMAAQLARMAAEANAERRMAEESKRALDIATEQREAVLARVEQLELSLEQERTERRDLVVAKATLEAEAHRLRRRVEEALAEREAEAAPEIAGLESALRERGRRIASLERDLRESERIGRELIAEVEAMHAETSEGGGGSPAEPGAPLAGSPPPVASPPAAATRAAPMGRSVDLLTADAFQHRIDALAAEAAQKEAELLSSTWRIQALERELGEARRAKGDPPAIQREVEAALVRAQSEIADLRRALGSGREGTGVPRAVVEDAVLLHQQMAR